MKKWRYLLIASILIFTMACGLIDVAKNLTGGKDDPEATLEATVETEDEIIVDEDANDDDSSAPDNDDTGVDASDDETIAVDDNAFALLDSYRVHIYWGVTYADGTSEVMDMQVSTTRDPAAYQYVMESNGEAMEMIQIGDTMWLRFGDEWMASTSEDTADDSFTDFLFSGDDMSFSSWSKDDYKYLGKETVNGIETKHYQGKYNEFWMGFIAQENIEDVEDGVADFWIANENDLPEFVVKMTMSVKGIFDDQEGEWIIEQEVSDVNEPFTIEAPEGVTVGLPDDVPEYPNAEEFASFGGMVTFSTADSVEDVAAFYADELATNGWTQDESNNLDTMVMATYSKDGKSLTLTISADEDSTSVLLMIE